MGYLSLVLHAHLPFVRHPEYEEFLEERWLFEAITECYLPLLEVFHRLEANQIPFSLTISFSPTLISMLLDPLLQERYRKYLNKSIELAQKEFQRTRSTPFQPLAKMYLSRFQRCLQQFDECKGNILNGYLQFFQKGFLELITTTATHAYLPALRHHPQAIRAQIKAGIELYKSIFPSHPPGMWLPECGYFPGLEQYLAQEKILYFFLERHGLEYATPQAIYGVYAPVYTPAGVAAFGRDAMTSEQVWSSEVGYPGDPDYREFYRDIGYDLEYDYIRPYINPDGARIHTGIKYYRITGKTNQKEIYNPQRALQKAAWHAEDFLQKVSLRLQKLQAQMSLPPLIVSPYDAELFGHWWYEGPLWLEWLFVKLHFDYPQLQAITPSQYLRHSPTLQLVQPATSSWGKNGYSEVWLNSQNAWIYRHLLQATEEMIYLCQAFPQADGELREALDQACRELFLAQSSDWPFLIHTQTAMEYAKKRLQAHIGRFFKIAKSIRENRLDAKWLQKVQYLDNIFPQISYTLFQN
ncbi:MAG: DUF1957 domain-containing protein [Planctomycetota bacterium]|nr:MAG: DUF1957 domain-containing protein [Planctomycetota bacterium]